MDHKIAKSRRMQTIGCAGFVTGQAIGYAGLVGGIYLAIKTIKSHDEIIKLQDHVIEAKETTIQVLDDLLEIHQSGLKANYKEIVAPSEVALDEKERKDIEALLTEELPLEESKKRIRENICRIETSFVNIRFNPEVVKNEVSGTCLLLTPTVVLTAYHIPDALEYSFFDESLSYIAGSDSDYGSAYQPIAISPRYDLALLRLDKPLPSVKPVPVGIAPQDIAGNSLFLYSLQYTNDSQLKYGLSVEEHMLTVQEREGPDTTYIMTTEGRLGFPSLIAKPHLAKGYSGSPVLGSDGKLIGIYSKGNEKNDTAVISDHVYSFLNCLLEQPQCRGWENNK